MKRRLLGLVLVCFMFLGLGLVISAKAEGEPETPVYACVVKVNEVEHGDVIVTTLEGNPGDIITITADPDVLYVLDAVYANGNQILKNEEGLYQFALVEGENTVGAKFVLNNEALETVMEMVEKTKDEGFDSLFTVKNLVILISALISLLTGTSLLIVVAKFKALKELTTKEVTAANQGAYNQTLTNINNNMIETNTAVNTLARCMVLAQEGTPEAKLAIIDEITKLSETKDKLADEVKDAINQGIAELKEAQNAKIKAIQELEEANNNLTNKNGQNEPNNGNVGRY